MRTQLQWELDANSLHRGNKEQYDDEPSSVSTANTRRMGRQIISDYNNNNEEVMIVSSNLNQILPAPFQLKNIDDLLPSPGKNSLKRLGSPDKKRVTFHNDDEEEIGQHSRLTDPNKDDMNVVLMEDGTPFGEEPEIAYGDQNFQNGDEQNEDYDTPIPPFDQDGPMKNDSVERHDLNTPVKVENKEVFSFFAIKELIHSFKSKPVKPKELEFILKSRNKNREPIIINKLTRAGTKDTSFLRTTVLINFHGKPKAYASTSMWVLEHDNWMRELILWVVESRLFEFFILFIILLNSITLAMLDYSDRDSKTKWNQQLDQLNSIFTAIFTLEAVLKIIALGFFYHQNAYLRELWNIIDFIVVLTGIIELSSDSFSGEMRIIRTVRVLRPLKTVNTMPELKKHVDILVNTMPKFLNVGFFLIFAFTLMSILGIHQYHVSFYNRCRFEHEPEVPGVSWRFDVENERLCTMNGLGLYNCPNNQTCGNSFTSGIPVRNDSDMNSANIFYGVTTFNNLGSSLLLVNQFVSTDSWSKYMYNLMDVDHPAISVVYSLMTIIVGTFFIMNLILAVIQDTFVRIQETQYKKERQKKLTIEVIVDEDDFLTPEELENRQLNTEDNLEEFQNEIQSVWHQLKDMFVKNDDGLMISNARGREMRRDRTKQEIMAAAGVEDIGIKRQATNRVNQAILEEPNLYEDEEEADIDENDQEEINNGELEEEEDEEFNFTEEENNNGDECMEEDQQNQIFSDEADPNQLKISRLGQGRLKVRKLRHNKVIKVDVLMRRKNNEAKRKERIKEKLKLRSETFWVYDYAFKVAESPYFMFFITLNILTITIVQSLDQYPEPSYIRYLDRITSLIQFAFIFEITVKMLAYGINHYFRDPFNIFDCTILLTSIIDIIISNFLGEQNVNNVTILRFFRVLRQFKLAKIWQSFNNLLRTMWKSIKDISTFTIILLLFMFIFTMLGMEVFAHKAKFNESDEVDLLNGGSKWQNFDSFLWAFTTNFVLLTEDGWSNIYQSHHRAVDATKANLYFLFFFIIGPKILLNLFLAILLDDFDQDSVETELTKQMVQEGDEETKKKAQEHQSFDGNDLFGSIKNEIKQVIEIAGQQKEGKTKAYEFSFYERIIMYISKHLRRWFPVDSPQSMNQNKINPDILREIIGGNISKQQELKAKKQLIKEGNNDVNAEEELKKLNLIKNFTLAYTRMGTKNIQDQDNDDTHKAMLLIEKQSQIDIQAISKSISHRNYARMSSLTKTMAKPPISGMSLKYFDQNNRFRIFLYNMVTDNEKFDNFILIFIMISSIHLAFTGPLVDPNGQVQLTLYWVDFITTIVFLIEFLMKIIANGFLFNGQQSYLRNGWNFVDFVILVLSLTAISPLTNRLQVFKMFRNLRIFRLISRAQGLRIGLQAIIMAIPDVLKIVLIMLVFYIIFGAIAISYFKGKFNFCNYDSIKESYPDFEYVFEIVHKWDCINAGAEWDRRYYNFDNMYQAMASLFIMSNIAGWADFMYIGAQVTEIDYVWRQWTHPYWVFFFIGFMVLGAFFLVNLFVGIVVSSYNRQNDLLGGITLMSDKQKEMIEVQLMVLKSRPIPKPEMPTFLLGKYGYNLVYNYRSRFELIIYGCICLNTIILTLQWEGQSTVSSLTMKIVNYFFTMIFIFEALLKIAAMRSIYFLHDPWNRFDFLIVVISVIGIILDYLQGINIGSATTVLRVFRLYKGLNDHFRKLKTMRRITKTFIESLKPLANIGSLLLLVLYIYTIAGVILFGVVKRNGVFTDALNFESFPKAALSLFVVATGDGWTDIMHACLKRRSVDFYCIDHPTYHDYQEAGNKTVGCGPGAIGHIYFYSYFLVMNLVLLKLFIAIICQVFDEIRTKDKQLFNQDRVDDFKEIWQKYDQTGDGIISTGDIKSLLYDIGQPLGFNPLPEEVTEEQALEIDRENDDFVRNLDLPTYQECDFYFYTDVLDSLASRITIYDFVKRDKKMKKAARQEQEDTDNTEENEEEKEPVLKKDDEFENLDQITEKDCADERAELFKEMIQLSCSARIKEIFLLKDMNVAIADLNKWKNVTPDRYGLFEDIKNAAKRMLAFIEVIRKLRELEIKDPQRFLELHGADYQTPGGAYISAEDSENNLQQQFGSESDLHKGDETNNIIVMNEDQNETPLNRGTRSRQTPSGRTVGGQQRSSAQEGSRSNHRENSQNRSLSNQGFKESDDRLQERSLPRRRINNR